MLLRNRGSGQFDVYIVGASTKLGNGERGRVAAIDHDGDDIDGVLVVNAGGGVAGPLQLMVPTGTPLPGPNAPSNLSANARSQSRIVLNWRDNAANEQGFRIERRLGDGPWSAVGEVGANVRRYVSTGLSPGTTYGFRVASYNAVGTSDYSNEATATTFGSARRPQAPSDVVARLAAADEIVLSWRDNADNEQGFRIERKIRTGPWTQVGEVGPDVISLTDRDLKLNTVYRYRVRAFNAKGASGFAVSGFVRTPR
jgi:hypothetical protein